MPATGETKNATMIAGRGPHVGAHQRDQVGESRPQGERDGERHADQEERDERRRAAHRGRDEVPGYVPTDAVDRPVHHPFALAALIEGEHDRGGPSHRGQREHEVDHQDHDGEHAEHGAAHLPCDPQHGAERFPRTLGQLLDEGLDLRRHVVASDDLTDQVVALGEPVHVGGHVVGQPGGLVHQRRYHQGAERDADPPSAPAAG